MIKQIFKLLWKKRTNNAFLVVEMVLAFLILFGVISLSSKFLDRYQQPLGLKHENTAYAFIDFPTWQKQEFNFKDKPGYDTLAYRDRKRALQRSLVAVSGIEELSFTNSVAPYLQNNWSTGNTTNDKELISYDETQLLFADEHFDKVYDINVIDGKWIEKEELQGKYESVVVNQLFVDRFYKDKGSIVGQKLHHYGEVKEIVGVVDNFKYQGDFFEEKPLMFPYLSRHDLTLFAQFKYNADTNPNWEADFQRKMEQEMRGIDFTFNTMTNQRWGLNRRFWAPMIGLFALCGFLLINIAMGLFGILQYNIKKRRGEIGLRKALGATNGSIRGQFISETMILTAIALMIGFVFAIQVPLLKLFDIDNKYLYFGIAVSAGIILFIVLLCSILPSAQASRIEPAVALHEE